MNPIQLRGDNSGPQNRQGVCNWLTISLLVLLTLAFASMHFGEFRSSFEFAVESTLRCRDVSPPRVGCFPRQSLLDQGRAAAASSRNRSSCTNSRPVIDFKAAIWNGYADVIRSVGGGNVSAPAAALQAEVGYLDFVILDVAMNGSQPVGLCYDGDKAETYQSASCPSESSDFASLHRQTPIKFHGGGKGFDFRLVGPSIVWGPVIDHRNGVYTVRVRVEDPGTYTAEVHLNDDSGCQYADCDTPSGVCSSFLAYDARMNLCKGDGTSPSPCFSLAITQQVVVRPNPRLALCSSASSQQPTISPPGQIGTLEGRWVRPQHLNPSQIFGQADWPFVWQAYDCVIPWPTNASIEKCLHARSSQFLFVGLSRERTNFFDLAEVDGREFEHEKLMDAASFGNLHYVSLYWPGLEDMKTWNAEGRMQATLRRLESDIAQLGICGNDERTTHILATEESLWTTEHAIRGAWSNLSSTFLSKLVSVCPKPHIQYKTATSLRSQHRSLSWQRMWEATGVAAAIATRELNLSVVDSFAVTQPLVAERSIFPDGLHLFRTDQWLQGNFVSKTVSMLFLAQACPEMVTGKEDFG